MSTALVPFADDDAQAMTAYTAPSLVLPIASATEVRAAVKAYEDLKAAIITPRDLQRISGKDHIKKSGWLRIARAFGLTTKPVSERFETAEDGSFGYAVVVAAIAPNGASMQGDGMCWSTEKAANQRTRHNVRAHAYTRATNRAISNLVGGGEVSAEELQDYVDSAPITPSLPASVQPVKPAADDWAEVRQLVPTLKLTDTEREDLFKRTTPPKAKGGRNSLAHRNAVLAEVRRLLAERDAKAQETADEQDEQEMTFTVDATPVAAANDANTAYDLHTLDFANH